MHNTFYTVNELLDVLSNPESWNKVKDMVRNGSDTTNPPVKETSKEETTEQNTLGSIFDEESLTQAIHQYENEINDETVAYQKVIEAKKEKINQLKARLVKEQMKSRVTQQGNYLVHLEQILLRGLIGLNKTFQPHKALTMC